MSVSFARPQTCPVLSVVDKYAIVSSRPSAAPANALSGLLPNRLPPRHSSAELTTGTRLDAAHRIEARGHRHAKPESLFEPLQHRPLERGRHTHGSHALHVAVAADRH